MADKIVGGQHEDCPSVEYMKVAQIWCAQVKAVGRSYNPPTQEMQGITRTDGYYAQPVRGITVDSKYLQYDILKVMERTNVRR